MFPPPSKSNQPGGQLEERERWREDGGNVAPLYVCVWQWTLGGRWREGPTVRTQPYKSTLGLNETTTWEDVTVRKETMSPPLAGNFWQREEESCHKSSALNKIQWSLELLWLIGVGGMCLLINHKPITFTIHFKLFFYSFGWLRIYSFIEVVARSRRPEVSRYSLPRLYLTTCKYMGRTRL